jgi:hypothetical protein
MPPVARLGLVLAGCGIFADVVHHGFTENLHISEALHIGVIGHVLTLAGMLLALSGVVHAAAGSRRRAREKGEGHAARSSTAVPR